MGREPLLLSTFRRQLGWPIVVATLFFLNSACLGAGFCEDAINVFASSTKLFDLASNQLRENSWETAKSIAGFKSCKIRRLPDTSTIFACEMARKRSLGSVKRETVFGFQRFTLDVKKCAQDSKRRG
jgi:hypothetical protein